MALLGEGGWIGRPPEAPANLNQPTTLKNQLCKMRKKKIKQPTKTVGTDLRSVLLILISYGVRKKKKASTDKNCSV